MATMTKKNTTPPEAPAPELHGAALVADILRRRIEAKTVARDAEQARLRADPRPAELKEKLGQFLAQCGSDIQSWAAMNVRALEDHKVGGYDLLRQIQGRAVALRDHIRQRRTALDEIPERIAGMTLDTFASVGHAIETDLMDWAGIPAASWEEYRAIRTTMESWEAEYTS